MDLIVKKASELTTEEKAATGITGIPNDWPVESYPYTGTVPTHFVLMTDVELVALKANNQAAYDAWLTSIKVQIVQASVPVDADNIPIITTKNVDIDDRPQYRRIVTRPSWLYSPKSLDFYTAKYGSLYNRNHHGAGYYDGGDIGDAYMQFYDASNAELVKTSGETDEAFQARLTAGCVKTIMLWENAIAFDVQGAILYVGSTPVAPAWLWCIAAPDVPEAYGGSKPFMGRGMNLKMMAPMMPHIYDAVSASTVNPDPVYHSNKIAIVVKHGLGEQIGIQFVVVCYEA